jgi:hypothetical protein
MLTSLIFIVSAPAWVKIGPKPSKSTNPNIKAILVFFMTNLLKLSVCEFDGLPSIVLAPNRKNVCQEQGWNILRGISMWDPPG